VLINPEIIEESGSWPMEEGCLSIPDVRADVTRAERVKVKFRNANFEEEILEAGGLLGRVVLHEIDHLNGVLFLDHLTSAKRGLLSPKLRKIKKGDTEAAYPVVIASEAKKSGKVEV
jgi:peptide deformylase